MILVDVNVLVYATNKDAAHHEACKTWWETAASGHASILLPWTVLTSVIRLLTNPRVMTKPRPVEEALAVIDDWLALPQVRVPSEPEGHWERLRELLREAGTAGSLTTDAHLAALAMGCGATLWSCDNDFARFDGLRYRNPLRHSL